MLSHSTIFQQHDRELVVSAAPECRHLSPQSSMQFPYKHHQKVLDPVFEGKTSRLVECHGLPKAPLKRVTFSSCEVILMDSSFTQAISKETISLDDKEQDDHVICYDGNGNGYDDYASIVKSPTSSVAARETATTTATTTATAATTTTTTVTATETDVIVAQSFKRTRRQKVRWSDRVRVIEICHLNDMSESEKESVWMSPTDYKLIKNMARATLYMMLCGENIDVDNPDFCARGLEHRTRAGSRIRNKNKFRIRSAVLDEQDIQREEGYFDPAFIAFISMEESSYCRHVARRRAESDALSTRSYMSESSRGVRVLLF